MQDKLDTLPRLNFEDVDTMLATPLKAARSITNKTGFTGVGYRKSSKTPWRAFIVVDRKKKSLGCFSTAEEAAHAYDNEVRRLKQEVRGCTYVAVGQRHVKVDA
jgi:hypothetical protein